jgi:pyruvate-ferredoxin/flavodoxin oxidoreductase
VADWAATEPRFGRHFKPVKRSDGSDRLVPFHEYLEMDATARKGRVPFIHVQDEGGKLGRMTVSEEIVELARDRIDLWNEVREMAGLLPSARVQASVRDPLEAEFETRMNALRAEYEAKLADLRASYPALLARRIAEALVEGRSLGAPPTPAAVVDLVARAAEGPVAGPGPAAGVAVMAAPAPAPAAAPAAPAGAEDGAQEPYIDTELCTTCNECTNLNPRLFAYNADKKAYIKDPRGGTFRELVMAAEKCPAQLIHPGTPLNPKEPDLAKWIPRAARFNG